MARLDLTVDVDVNGANKLNSLGSGLQTAATNLVKFGAVAGAAFAGVAAVSSNAASNLNESLNAINVAFGDAADDINALGESAADSLGLSQRAFNEAAVRFSSFADTVAGEGGDVAGVIDDITSRGTDFASVFNLDVEEALQIFQSGLAGESEPLRRFGIDLSAAAVEAYALSEGISDGNGPLTEAQKIQARYGLLLRETAETQGDFANTSEGMANQQRILAATFEDTLAEVGQAFVPIIEAILPQVTAGLQGFGQWVTDNMPAIQNTISTVLDIIGGAFGFFTGTVLPAVITVFQGVASWISENLPTIQGVATGVFATISGAVTAFTQNVLPILISVFQSVVGWVRDNLPLISSVAGQVFGAIANVIKSVSPAIEWLATYLFPVVGAAASLLFEVMDKAFKGIGGAFEALGAVFEAVEPIIKDVFRAVVGFVKGIWNTFVGFWNGIEITVPSVDIPLVGRVGGFSIGLPDLPMLAAGGIVTGPTLALIGEKGPEAVIPLDRMGAGGLTVEVNVLGDLRAEDPEQVAGAIGRVLWTQGISDAGLFAGGTT